MGLFKKKNRGDEDFILDFASNIDNYEEKPQDDNALGVDKEFNIPSWETREKITAPHAMTVNEILGSMDSEGDNIPDEGIKPRQQINADDLSKNSSLKPEQIEIKLPEQPKEIEMPIAQEMPVEAPKTQEALVEMPKETAEPLFEEPQELPSSKDDKIEKEANELIARLKLKKSQAARVPEASQPEKAPVIEASQPEKAPIIEAPQKEAPAVPVTEVATPVPQSIPTLGVAIPEQNAPAKKETTLSPAAQALYDRMMAQRAKRQLAGDDKRENIHVSGDILTSTQKNEEKIAEPEAIDTDITPVYEDKTLESFQNEEILADSIFSSLKDSLKDENPLIRRKQAEGESLLQKCKNYVTPKNEFTEESIDNIIHTAEQGARERLNNLYDVHEGESIKNTSSFDFGTRIIGVDSAKTVSVPVKVIEESADKAVISSHTGEIKNFQFSFADGDSENIPSATKIIDMKLGATPHKSDTAKIEAIRMHLDAMAYETDEVELPKVKLTGNDESGTSDTIQKPEMPSMDDYNSFEDKAGIKTDLASKRVSLIARLIPSAFIFLLLLLLNFLFKDNFVAASPMGFSVINLALLGIALAINHNTIKGLGNLFTGAPDMDSPAALSVSFAFVWALVSLLSGSFSSAPILTPVAVLTLVFNLLGKLSILSRISKGFETMATPSEKYAVSFVEDKLDAAIMANGSVIGEALVTTGKKTLNIRDFLKNSYSEDIHEKSLRPLIITSLAASLLFAIIGFIVSGEFSGALSALLIASLFSCPVGILAVNLPLSSTQKKLSYYNAMIAGHSGAEAIANANAVSFSASELFPEGTVKLYNMHVLNKGAIDKYLTSAAAVLGEADSPLCPIFKEMIEDSKEPLPKADSIKYESRMGVSGWIGEHRVFIGNRTLMEGHGIKVPSLEIDKKILRGGYFPVYLAFDQQLCALFIVGYEADPAITYELRKLCSTGVTMLINTNDPNVTEEMLCDYFGLYPDLVKLLSASGVSAYKKNTAFCESVSAPASYSGDICGFLSLITAAINLKKITKTSFVLQIILSVLGLVASGYMIVSGLMTNCATALLGYQLLSGAVAYIVSKIKQP